MKHVFRGRKDGLAEAAATINQAIGWRRYLVDEEEPGLVDWIDDVEQHHRPAIPVLTSPGLWVDGAEYSLRSAAEGKWRITTPDAVYIFEPHQVPDALQRYADLLEAVCAATDSILTARAVEDASLLADWLNLNYNDED